MSPVTELGHVLPPWNVSESIREQFRKIRALVCPNEDSLCIAICSYGSGEGVSWVASKLACAVAESSRNTALLDANHLHPAQTDLFGLSAGQPFACDPDVQFTMFPSRFPQLTVIAPERRPQGYPGTLSTSLAAAIAALRERGNFLVVDCQPAATSAQVLHLAQSVDGLLFVVEAERQRREVIGRMLESFKRAQIPIVGVLLNKRRQYIPPSFYRML